jgi:hypothetical protein
MARTFGRIAGVGVVLILTQPFPLGIPVGLQIGEVAAHLCLSICKNRKVRAEDDRPL